MRPLIKIATLSLGLVHSSLAEVYPSLPSKVIANYTIPKSIDYSVQAQVKAAESFLGSLSDEEKKIAQVSYDHEAKRDWTNLPQRPPQLGARLGDLNESQITNARHLLSTILGKNGLEKAIAIPLADDLLLDNGKRKEGYGAEDFWILISGEPSSETPWAIQFDGHHLAYNITISGENMSLSPSFIGIQPRSVTIQGKEIDPFSSQYASVYAFMDSLDQDQKSKAIVSKKRGRILTAAGKDGFIPPPSGLSVKTLDDSSKELLLQLIATYVNDLPAKAAQPRLNNLKKQLNQTTFAWSGPTEKNSDFSYRIQGPTLIIEFSHQSFGGNPLNHLHAMYRDPTNEYGAQFPAK